MFDIEAELLKLKRSTSMIQKPRSIEDLT